MITQALIEGIKSVVTRSLMTPSASHQPVSLALIFMGGIAGISLILIEVFFGLSAYKMLRFDYGYSEGLSMLLATGVYMIQIIVSIGLIKHHLKKAVHQNIIVKEYNQVKDIVNALIEGFKSK